MAAEPILKRAFAYIDGQNLFYAAKSAFGYSFPNYAPDLLAAAVCASKGWQCSRVCFYTGIPEAHDSPVWNRFWQRKLAAMGSRGVQTFSRPLRYRSRSVTLPDGSQTTISVGQEKGIDIRLALDVVSHGRAGLFDVALVFSQDQDLSEVAQEIRTIAREHQRWIKIASAYPVASAGAGRTTGSGRGINGTDWIAVERSMYDRCVDPRDYRV